MKNSILHLISISVFVIFLFGCSSGNQPIFPNNGSFTLNQISSLPIGVSERFPDGSPASGMGALGLFQLSLNPNNETAELTSLRQTASNDVLEIVDISNFLQMAPCHDCAKIGSVSLDADGNIVVSIGIKHPFPAGDPLAPISGRNRADLHVFNIEGTIYSNTAGTVFSGIGKTTAGVTLVNADGYSAYLDNNIDEIYPTDATVHPYILHFDDYTAGNFDASNIMGFASVTTPPPSGNLVMAMGCDYDYQDYVFDIDGTFDFIYVVGCSYGLSSLSKSTRFNPEYRIPQHNKKAASEISIEIITNDLKGEDTLSTANIEIHVVDVSHGVIEGTELDTLRCGSSVSSIVIDIPNVEISPVNVNISAPTGTGHSPSDPLVYSATITNTGNAPEGSYLALIKVLDGYLPDQNGAETLGCCDGIGRVDPTDIPISECFKIPELATYQTFIIDVASGNDLPVADLVSNPDPANINQFETVDFDATASYDTDGSIVLYEFDWEWDGIEVNFSVNNSSTTGTITSEPYENHGTITTGLRVTDDLGGFGYDSVTINVAEITIIYVDDSNVSGTEDGTQANPYNTIQEGINAAVDGSHICVDDSGSSYMEEIQMKSGVLVCSSNWDDSDGGNRATIDGPNGIDEHSVVFNSVSNATLTGFQIGFCGVTTVGNTMKMIMVAGGSGNMVQDCLFTGDTGATQLINCIAVSSSTDMVVEYNRMDSVDSSTTGCQYFGAVHADNCPNVKVNNNLITNIRDTSDSSMKMMDIIHIENTVGVTIKNNLIHHITPDASAGFGNVVLMSGIYTKNCSNVVLANNTIDQMDSRLAFMIQEIFCFNIDSCTSVTFTNNIISSVYGNGFPPPCVRAVRGLNNPFVCDYTCTYDIGPGTNGSNYYGSASAGAGCITSDPDYNDPGNEDYDVSAASPAQSGDPSIDDWDGTPGSGSRMGCHGGPGGETVGLLT